LIVADSHASRDGQFIEILGSWDPVPDKELLTVDQEKVKAWMKKGALPTVGALRLLYKVGLVPRPDYPKPPAKEPAAKAAAAAPAAAAKEKKKEPAAAAPEAARKLEAEAVPEVPAKEKKKEKAPAAPEAKKPEAEPAPKEKK